MAEKTLTDRNDLSCREGGKRDHQLGLKAKLTLWGKVSKDRASRGISRKARRERRAA